MLLHHLFPYNCLFCLLTSWYLSRTHFVHTSRIQCNFKTMGCLQLYYRWNDSPTIEDTSFILKACNTKAVTIIQPMISNLNCCINVLLTECTTTNSGCLHAVSFKAPGKRLMNPRQSLSFLTHMHTLTYVGNSNDKTLSLNNSILGPDHFGADRNWVVVTTHHYSKPE